MTLEEYRALANVLEIEAPRHLQVTTAWSWKPSEDEFVADVVVHPRSDETARITAGSTPTGSQGRAASPWTSQRCRRTTQPLSNPS